MTEALRSHFDDYARFHRTAGNKACHSFGIPIIVLASLALLARVPLVAPGRVRGDARRAGDRRSSSAIT